MDILTEIIKKSFDQNYFSDKWKTAILRPLLKKKSDLELKESNYRPVSNLSFISKLVEHAALDHFNYHQEYNQITPTHQSAYKEHHSCETLLLKLTNNILWHMEKKEVAALVCLDLSAAFDTVDHTVLLKTLENCFGVSDDALLWFHLYLTDRSIKVFIGKQYSENRSIKYSVPQGSINGPVLLNCYCSTPKNCIPDTINLNGFADDHTLLSSFTP